MELGVRARGLDPVEHQVDHGQLDEGLRRLDALSRSWSAAGIGPATRTSAPPSTGSAASPSPQTPRDAHDGQLPPRVRLDPLVQLEVVVLVVGVHRTTLPIGWPSSRENSSVAARASSTSAAVTRTASSRPRLSTTIWRFPVDVLEVVAAPLLAAGGGVDRLAVDARGGAGVVRLLHRADLAAEPVVDQVQGAICRHRSKYRQTVLLGGKSMGR